METEQFERAAAHNRDMRERFMSRTEEGGLKLECEISVPIGQEEDHMRCYENQESVEVEYQNKRYIGRLLEVDTDTDEGVCVFKFVGMENIRGRHRRRSGPPAEE
jgi:hypothetical protein